MIFLTKKVVMMNYKLKFWQDQPLLVTVLQITIFALLLLARTFCLVTIGVFGKQWNDTKNFRKFDHNVNTDVCFLYLSNGGFGKDFYCDYTVYGQGIVAVALLILFVLMAVIVFLRSVYSPDHVPHIINCFVSFLCRLRFGIDLVAFLVIAVITFIFSLIASIVLSDGFAKSCSTIKNLSSNVTKYKLTIIFFQSNLTIIILYRCSDPFGLDKDIYNALQSSAVGTIIINQFVLSMRLG